VSYQAHRHDWAQRYPARDVASVRTLGSAVTISQKADQLAEREDADVAEVLQKSLHCLAQLGEEVRGVKPTSRGLRVQLTVGSSEDSHLFPATGRQPNTDDPV